MRRRQFLKTTATAALAASACSSIRAAGIAARYEGLATERYLSDLKTVAKVTGPEIFTEGPCCDRAGNVYFTNTAASQILKWDGKQLLSPGWIDLATTKQVSNGSDPARDWDQGYGFQFWRCRHGAYRGDGKDGQFCVVLPEQDAVVAITANTGDMQAQLNIVWDKLLPAFSDKPLKEDADEQARLKEVIGKLKATR